MTDRPILFSGPMVRALLDGRKTQTRRVAKITAIMGNKVAVDHPDERLVELEKGEFRRGICHYESTGGLSGPYRLPCAVGDRLWVREAWQTHAAYDDISPVAMGGDEAVRYEADGAHQTWGYPAISKLGRYRQGIHMPRWASRIALIVTDVRVQRLQEISSSDAAAEGVSLGEVFHSDGLSAGFPEPVLAFRNLWDSLNAARGYGWETNPWIVAITFRAIKQNIDQIREQAA